LEASQGAGGSFRAAARPVTGLREVEEVACGSSHVLARCTDGALYSWGFGVMLQLGNGVDQDEPVPRRVQMPAGKVVKVSAGGQHSCALVAASAAGE
jgi:alpha-tubulin suppressor-like RCC1 family protein